MMRFSSPLSATASPANDERSNIQQFLTDCSVEVTPRTAAKFENLSLLFTPSQRVYVTFLPGSDYHETVTTASRLQQAGAIAVPHIAARSLTSAVMLEDFLAKLAAEGVKHALLIGGGVDKPLGPYGASMEVLRSGLFEKYQFQQIGLAGHPEGTPDIPAAAVMQALLEKNAYARHSSISFHLVTQFCFEAKPIIEWDKALLQAGNQLPIHLGLPGLATIKTLLKHAQACGVGPSMRILTKQAANITKLLTVNAPDALTRDLARYQADCRANNSPCGISHAHLFPLGGLETSLHWLKESQLGRFELGKKGGFTLTNPN